MKSEFAFETKGQQMNDQKAKTIISTWNQWIQKTDVHLKSEGNNKNSHMGPVDNKTNLHFKSEGNKHN